MTDSQTGSALIVLAREISACLCQSEMTTLRNSHTYFQSSNRYLGSMQLPGTRHKLSSLIYSQQLLLAWQMVLKHAKYKQATLEERISLRFRPPPPEYTC